MRERGRQLLLVGLLVVLCGAAVWARCANWRNVFTAEGVELLPTDSHYYVRFARLQLEVFPRFVRFDPYMDYPAGALQLWSPVQAWAIAGAIRLAGIDRAEAAAAWVGPGFSLLELALLAWLSWRWRGARSALATTWLYGLIPVSVFAGCLGNADHHVHEGFVIALVALASGRALETGSRRAAAIAGVALGLGRVLAPTAFVFILPVALAWPLVARWRRDDARAAADAGTGRVAAACCVGVLALAVALVGNARTLEYEELSWFHPLFALGVFSFCLAALPGARRSRLGWLALSVGAALPLVPQLLRGLTQLGRADPILAAVDESVPLLRDPGWAVQLLGVGLLGLPVAVFGVARAVRQRSDFAGVPALAATVMLLAMAALQARFSQALAGALAVLLPMGVPHALPVAWPDKARFAARALAAVALASLGFSLLPKAVERPDDKLALSHPTLTWMRTHLPPASPDPYGPAHPSWGVACDPKLGHLVLLWAERPVVACPMGQLPVHEDALARNGALLSATDDEEAYRLAVASGVRYVLATPSNTLIGSASYDPHRSLLGRLVDGGGIDAQDPARTTAHFRLIHESAEVRRRTWAASYARLFEVVEGSVLEGVARPGETVRARTRVVADRGETLTYERATVADAAGKFSLRLAYACDPRRPETAYDVYAGDVLVARKCVGEANVAEGLAKDSPL